MGCIVLMKLSDRTIDSIRKMGVDGIPLPTSDRTTRLFRFTLSNIAPRSSDTKKWFFRDDDCSVMPKWTSHINIGDLGQASLYTSNQKTVLTIGLMDTDEKQRLDLYEHIKDWIDGVEDDDFCVAPMANTVIRFINE